MPSEKYVVMISSTARDLPLYREQVRDACLQAGAFPKMMEHLPPKPEDAMAVSTEMVDEAAVYVGIFAYKYGSAPEGHDKSFTQIEYEQAIARGIPVLIFIMDESVAVLPKDIDKGAKADKLEAFKAHLRETHVVSFYKSPEDLRGRVYQGLMPYLKGSGHTGEKNLPNSSLTGYLEGLHRQCQILQLAQIGGQAGLGRSITLSDVYIGLGTTTPDQEDLPSRAKALEREEIRYLSAQEAASRSKRMVLLGDPGSGKSTFVKQLLGRMAEQCLGSGEGPVPAFIVLRDLAPRLGQAKEKLEGLSLDRRQRRLAELVAEQVTDDLEVLGATDAKDAILSAFQKGHVYLVFDGLDEVPYDLRLIVHEAVDATMLCYQLEHAIVTCRIRSYTEENRLGGFDEYTLALFDSEQIALFIDGWYNAQVQFDALKSDKANQLAEDLKQAVQQDHLRPLAKNPMLLTTMVMVHQQEAELPRDRVILYQKAVDILLRKWQQVKGPIPKELDDLLMSPDRIRPVIERLAYEAHAKGAADTAADLPRLEALEILESPEYLGDLGFANRFLNYVDERSGLLIGRGGAPERPGSYSFPHRTFQEYLAGCYLVKRRSAVRDIRKLAQEGNAWTIAVQLGAEELLINRLSEFQLLDNANALLPELRTITDEVTAREALWSAHMAQVAGKDAVTRDDATGEGYLKKVRVALIKTLKTPLPPIERAEAGRLLAHLGDPRDELLKLEAMPFCLVPGGPFLMGDENVEIEIPYDYWIGQYPVTEAQFKAFTDAGGYEDRQWWTEAGWKELKEVEKRIGPYRFDNPTFSLPNHPVVGVMWYEAQAFTRWLTHVGLKAGWLPKNSHILLPNEPEWEKAARGGLKIPSKAMIAALTELNKPSGLQFASNSNARRVYPWGDEITVNHASYGDTGIGSTSAPGCFIEGVSPYGVHDLSGNVWEWSRSLWEDVSYPKKAAKWHERETVEGGSDRVVRGGSWGNVATALRSAGRGIDLPGDRDSYLGFRLVRTVP